MTTTWIEVADTAVKIGLGAIISGLTGYALATTNHNRDLKKELIKTKTRILEEACSEAESYFSYVNKFLNSLGFLIVESHEGIREQTKEEQAIIESLHAEMNEALNCRNRAKAKISLLGLTSALNHINQFNETLTYMRNIVAKNSMLISENQHEEIAERFNKHKIAFYNDAHSYLNNVAVGKNI